MASNMARFEKKQGHNKDCCRVLFCFIPSPKVVPTSVMIIWGYHPISYPQVQSWLGVHKFQLGAWFFQSLACVCYWAPAGYHPPSPASEAAANNCRLPWYFCMLWFCIWICTCVFLYLQFVFLYMPSPTHQLCVFFCCIFWVAIVNLSLFMCFPSFASSASEQLHKTAGFSCLCFLGAGIGSGLPKSYASLYFGF